MPDDRLAHPLTAALGQRVHGLDLAVRRIKLFEGAAREQFCLVPGSPEGDVRCAQAIEVERVNAFGWRGRPAMLEMRAQQRGCLGAAEIILPDAHRWSASLQTAATGEECTARSRGCGAYSTHTASALLSTFLGAPRTARSMRSRQNTSAQLPRTMTRSLSRAIALYSQ